ncbi:MAG: nucleotidyltransferase family protein [Sandaracinaceae bacterium]|nr:nucleotidyltransferase family protein [Sandaracinaceae bacterium]
MRIGGVVLAAGRSDRAETSKAMFPYGNRTLVAIAAQRLLDAGAGEVVVVIAAPHGPRIAAHLGARFGDPLPGRGVRTVVNPRPENGMLGSLQSALSRGEAWDAAVVSLVDHPRVRAGTVARLIDAWRASAAELVRPVHAGHGGHPYVIARSVFPRLLAAPPVIGARAILHALTDRVDLEVTDPFVLEDLDYETQLRALADRALAR